MTERDLRIVSSKIDEDKEFLNSVSQNIWNTPETSFQEVHAHEILANVLDIRGFNVQRSYLLPTAFRADFSSGEGPTIAVLLEYDALPIIGHACGHNLIAEAGLAAGLAIKETMIDDLNIKGKIVIMGTPAEEKGGGKIELIKKHAFQDIDAAMMVHPCKYSFFDPPILNNCKMTVEFKGKESHSSAFPWEGVNALDAAVSFYQSLGLLRQQTKPSCRIQGIISKGGSAPNVIPADAELKIQIRTPTKKELNVLKSKIESCMKGAAISTGCTYSVVYEDNQYEDIVTNKIMKDIFKEFAEKLGLQETTEANLPAGSTDMGNVSYVVPSIHPFYSINTEAPNHNKEFTTASGSPAAQPPTLAAAKAMAMTALSLMRDPKKMELVKAEFYENVNSKI